MVMINELKRTLDIKRRALSVLLQEFLLTDPEIIELQNEVIELAKEMEVIELTKEMEVQ